MALDTITLRSPYVSLDVANLVETECVKRQGINIKTGELLYEITTASLVGSYDSKISVRVENTEFDGSVCVQCEPYIVLEASVHKAMCGHNIFGGPLDFRSSCEYLVKLVQNLIQVKLPCFELWKVLRVDVTEVYQLPAFESVEQWFKGLNSSNYPRRVVDRYGLSGIYVKGSTTALKFYHKGVEFQKHDMPRLKHIFKSDKIMLLRNKANKIIRCECEIKLRKLKYDFGKIPFVTDITNSYLNNVHDVEVQRFLKEGVNMMILVSNAHSVKERLYELYKPGLAGILLGTWYQLTTLGEDTVKKSLNKATYYRHLKLLKDAAVSWHCTDVILKEYSKIPEGFSPVRDNNTRIQYELPEIKFRLADYDIA